MKIEVLQPIGQVNLLSPTLHFAVASMSSMKLLMFQNPYTPFNYVLQTLILVAEYSPQSFDALYAQHPCDYNGYCGHAK